MYAFLNDSSCYCDQIPDEQELREGGLASVCSLKIQTLMVCGRVSWWQECDQLVTLQLPSGSRERDGCCAQVTVSFVFSPYQAASHI